MKTCQICGKQAGKLSSFRIEDGVICTDCYNKTPFVIRKSIKSYPSYTIMTAIEGREKSKKMEFNSTIVLGKLKIDEVHGLFGIKVSKTETDIFDCNDIEEASLSCSNLRVDKANHLYSDISFYCKLGHPNISFEVVIEKGRKCKATRNGNDLEWEEPGDLTLFRSLFNKAANNARKRYDEKKQIWDSKYKKELQDAMALFMIEGEYEPEDIRKIRNILIKAFHPDEVGQNTKQSRIINNAYAILMEEYTKTHERV